MGSAAGRHAGRRGSCLRRSASSVNTRTPQREERERLSWVEERTYGLFPPFRRFPRHLPCSPQCRYRRECQHGSSPADVAHRPGERLRETARERTERREGEGRRNRDTEKQSRAQERERERKDHLLWGPAEVNVRTARFPSSLSLLLHTKERCVREKQAQSDRTDRPTDRQTDRQTCCCARRSSRSPC